MKRLKLREVLSVKALVGGLRDENNPNKGASVFRFPVDSEGRSTSYTLGSQPYIEGSVGVANIFKLVRVDLVRRFSYLNNPNTVQWGVRTRFRLDF